MDYKHVNIIGYLLCILVLNELSCCQVVSEKDDIFSFESYCQCYSFACVQYQHRSRLVVQPRSVSTQDLRTPAELPLLRVLHALFLESVVCRSPSVNRVHRFLQGESVGQSPQPQRSSRVETPVDIRFNDCCFAVGSLEIFESNQFDRLFAR
jgi:hypothetical protein